jgi:hypothetical protein
MNEELNILMARMGIPYNSLNQEERSLWVKHKDMWFQVDSVIRTWPATLIKDAVAKVKVPSLFLFEYDPIIIDVVVPATSRNNKSFIAMDDDGFGHEVTVPIDMEPGEWYRFNSKLKPLLNNENTVIVAIKNLRFSIMPKQEEAKTKDQAEQLSQNFEYTVQFEDKQQEDGEFAAQFTERQLKEQKQLEKQFEQQNLEEQIKRQNLAEEKMMKDMTDMNEKNKNNKKNLAYTRGVTQRKPPSAYRNIDALKRASQEKLTELEKLIKIGMTPETAQQLLYELNQGGNKRNKAKRKTNKAKRKTNKAKRSKAKRSKTNKAKRSKTKRSKTNKAKRSKTKRRGTNVRKI